MEGLYYPPLGRSAPQSVRVSDYAFPPTSSKPDLPQEYETNLIMHDLIQLLGQTTNTLVFCFLDNNANERFTRVQIRDAVESHVAELKEKGEEEQYLARIQTGKAAVNYWIDRLVENNSIEKKHSKPVLFWRSTPYQSKTKPFVNSAPQNMYNHPWGA